MISRTPTKSIVTALHHVPTGELWEVDEIQKRKEIIERHGFTWSVVESLPIREEIKYQGPDFKSFIEKYKQCLINIGKCGLSKICYNFMSVIDWIRTDFYYPCKDKGISMLFDYPTFVAFDVHILNRPHAEKDYSDALLKKGESTYHKMSARERDILAHNIIVITQDFIHGGVGNVRDYKKAFLNKLALYNDTERKDLKDNLIYFLNEVLPVAEEQGVTMCLHPDDPPFPVLGLPRIAGTVADYRWIMDQNQSSANGITFCSGSLSSRPDNNLTSFLNTHIEKVHFAHLRNTTLLNEDGSFCESGHLEGGADMGKVIKQFHMDMKRRRDFEIEHHQIPMRPDHGLKLKEDKLLNANPGYPYYGRKKGLDELIMLEKNQNKM